MTDEMKRQASAQANAQASTIVDMVHAMVNDIEQMAGTVCAEDALSGLEERVEQWTRRIGQHTLQQGLDMYQQRAEPDRFPCPCGQAQAGNKGTRDASVTSLFGTVSLTRRVYACRQCGTVFSPGMEQLGLNGHTFTPRVQDAMATIESTVPQRQAAQMLEQLLRIKVSSSTVANVAVRWGQWFEQQRQPGLGESPHSFAGNAMYAGVDGTMVHSREGGWRELKIGSFYNDDKTAQAYYASFSGSQVFAQEWQDYAEWAGALDAEPVRATGDGAGWVWSVHESVFPHASIRFLDFWHVTEHLWDYARSAYGEGTSACKRWAEDMCHRLKHQGPQSVLRCVKRQRPKTPEAQEQRRQLQGYIENHVHLMDYPSLIAQEIDIGDGPVESACKLVGRRLKGGEKRWRLDRAQAIATLRCVSLSGEWPSLPKPRMANRSPEQRERFQPMIHNYNQAFARN
jgi:hypothetical protein